MVDSFPYRSQNEGTFVNPVHLHANVVGDVMTCVLIKQNDA